jgi:tetratricopeptide (TPR) repeat protein
MATAADTAYKVANLTDLDGDESDGRVRMDVRRHLGIKAFGTSAVRSDGGRLISEHDEAGFRIGQSGQEELYVVVAGRATFTVNGEQVDAPAGTVVFVGDPSTKRGAVSEEAGTIVLAVGGKPGEAFFALPEEFAAAFDAFNAKEYERSIELYEELLASGFPNRAGIVYNIACSEALLGRTDEALAHLREALEGDKSAVELAREDSDLDAIRDDPRFAELIGSS